MRKMICKQVEEDKPSHETPWPGSALARLGADVGKIPPDAFLFELIYYFFSDRSNRGVRSAALPLYLDWACALLFVSTYLGS